MNTVLENETSSTGRTLLFNDLDDAEMSVVSDVLLPKLYGPGEVIYREGEHGGSLNIIGKGKVRIQKMSDSGGQFCIATLKEGDVFGFMSFIGLGSFPLAYGTYLPQSHSCNSGNRHSKFIWVW